MCINESTFCDKMIDVSILIESYKILTSIVYNIDVKETFDEIFQLDIDMFYKFIIDYLTFHHDRSNDFNVINVNFDNDIFFDIYARVCF